MELPWERNGYNDVGGTTFLLNSSQLQSLGSSCQCFCKIFIRTESNIQTFISIISLALSSTTCCPINLGQIIIIITESSPVFCDLTQMSDTVWLHYSDNWPLLDMEQFHQFYLMPARDIFFWVFGISKRSIFKLPKEWI